MEIKGILETVVFLSQCVKFMDIEWVIQNHTVKSIITKLARLEETLLQETHKKNCTVNIEAKFGIRGGTQFIRNLFGKLYFLIFFFFCSATQYLALRIYHQLIILIFPA